MPVLGYTTPCTEPGCGHFAPYGQAGCCPPFQTAVLAWAKTEGQRLLAALPTQPPPGRRLWVEHRTGIHWSGGFGDVPSALVCAEAPSGWHNGVHYGGSETLAATKMPGFAEVLMAPHGTPTVEMGPGERP